jgi:DNA topoisomerase I
MSVVVVESPAKAKTINKYLGPGHTVLASFGHVRDLPPKDGSVDPEHDFEMKWEVASDSRKHVRAIAEALKSDPDLILATDPDREGEAISWHLMEALAKSRALKKDTPVKRVVFNAITKRRGDAGDEGPARGRHGTGARLSRPPRARLPGGLQPQSPVLWRKLPGAQVGGPRAVGLPAPDRRARDGDRGVSRPRILDRHRRTDHPARAGLHRPARHASGEKLEKFSL